ncbi:MAG: IMP cyclohydrolase [Chloroflexi bacterium]|nr:IMP cyclohydrolase [Chloroflexota bacterium]
MTYNAIRSAAGWAVAGNGTHTDPIIEKIADGMPVRDAIAMSLLALDYERDQYDTPRVCAAVPAKGDAGWLAIIRRDSVVVRQIPLKPGVAHYTATYEADDVRDSQVSHFDASNTEDAARFIIDGGVFKTFERPVTSGAALAAKGGFKLAAYVV